MFNTLHIWVYDVHSHLWPAQFPNWSFWLHLKNGRILSVVNNTTEKTAPKGAIDQIVECLACIIHAFAEAEEDTHVFMDDNFYLP